MLWTLTVDFLLVQPFGVDVAVDQRLQRQLQEFGLAGAPWRGLLLHNLHGDRQPLLYLRRQLQHHLVISLLHTAATHNTDPRIIKDHKDSALLHTVATQHTP